MYLPTKAEPTGFSSLQLIKIHLDHCQFLSVSSKTRIPMKEGSGVGVWGLSFVLKPCVWFSICMAVSDTVF